ncbi:hypothetical protein ACHAQI_004302 [Fusarium lateritium]
MMPQFLCPPSLNRLLLYLLIVSGILAQDLEARPDNSSSNILQDVVSYDQYSVMVRGERVLFLSGEFHPFRLPSPDLWLDVFQKIKSLGFSGVSFYTNWAILEGSPGNFQAEGVFALEKFFDAAADSRIYLLARPGPYVNAELSGGGYPGWVSRLKGPIRTTATEWLDATRNYIQSIGAIIAKAQITEGGPVILFQPENEYSLCADSLAGGSLGSIESMSKCLDPEYMATVNTMWREAGITVPFISNDALPIGNFVPGSGPGAVDIYGYDGYPLGWGTSCSDPGNWNRPHAIFPTMITNYTKHMEMSPSSPFSIVEFQGGFAEGWAGAGIDACASLVNHEFERVIYKTVYGFRATVLNLYMTFGGTNWGNLGHPQGYTSYDIGSAITEDRQVNREKYSELKLQANFLQVSPAYLTSKPQDSVFGGITNTTKLVTTSLISSEQEGGFYIIRHSDWTSREAVSYKLYVNVSDHELIIPQLGGSLTLSARDSKTHVIDYDIGHIRLAYSTAEIFTWKRSESKTILLIYGGEGETHEFAVDAVLGQPTRIEGDGVRYKQLGSLVIVQWHVEPLRRVVHFGNTLEVHLLWRNDAYNHWVLDLPRPDPVNAYKSAASVNVSDSSVIVKGGYLMRNATMLGDSLYLWGDVNTTATLQIVFPILNHTTELYFNNRRVEDVSLIDGRLSATIEYRQPEITLPDFCVSNWTYLDSLPETAVEYDDHLWTVADKTVTNSTVSLKAPTSLYASDYGYHSGSLIYRGHFKAFGNESSLFLSTSGGHAFGQSVWLNSTYLGSWVGDPSISSYNQTFPILAPLAPNSSYVITVLVDHMGLTQNTYIGVEGIKEPRGILDYSLSSHASASDIAWKVTGNLGGEMGPDISRGPRNEGGLFAERQGYHLPGAVLKNTEQKSPITHGIPGVGVGFFATNFTLDIPSGYDIPMSFTFANLTNQFSSVKTAAYRAQIYVNGWQFGEYVNNLGPQISYPVPQGILNYRGLNYFALTLWSLEPEGVRLDGLSLDIEAIVQSGYSMPVLVQGQTHTPREWAY